MARRTRTRTRDQRHHAYRGGWNRRGRKALCRYLSSLGDAMEELSEAARACTASWRRAFDTMRAAADAAADRGTN